MRKKIYLFLLFIFSQYSVRMNAQYVSRQLHSLDSLKEELTKAKYDTTKIRLRCWIGNTMMITRIGYWDSLVLDSKKYKLLSFEGKASTILGHVYRVNNNENKAFEYLNKGLTIAEKIGNKFDIMAALSSLASCYYSRNNMKLALDYYYKTLKIAEALADKKRIAGVYSQIALCYFSMNEINKSLSMNMYSLRIYKEIHYEHGIANTLLAIGTDYNKLKDYKKSVFYYMESKKYIGLFGDDMSSAEICNSVGAAYFLMKQYDSAYKYANKAYGLAKRINHKQAIVGTMATLANIKYEMGENESAKKIAIEAMEIVKTIHFTLQIPDLALTLKKIHLKDKNYKGALEAYEMQISARDSLTKEDIKKQALEKEFTYNLEKKEDTNKLLTQQNQIQSLELNRNKYLMSGFGLLVTLVLIIMWLLIRQNKLRAEQQSMLLEQKLISSQMNPHFVFNSLNSIQQLIMSKENDKAELYLSKFSKLIRELLESNAKESLTISEEADILKGYIEMEARRFGKSLTFSINIDEKINKENANIPHMMIQPFVENAIWHGLLPKDGHRNLTVNFLYDTVKTVKCIVKDNGVGREASRKKANTFKKRSLALSFIKQRLELMRETLKVNVSVEIIDEINGRGESLGTRVELILPLLSK